METKHEKKPWNDVLKNLLSVLMLYLRSETEGVLLAFIFLGIVILTIYEQELTFKICGLALVICVSSFILMLLLNAHEKLMKFKFKEEKEE